MCSSVPFLFIFRVPTITGMVVELISISRSLYLLIIFFGMLLSVGTDISIRKHVFLLLTLTTVSGLLFFIFKSVWIAKFLLLVLVGAETIF